MANYELWYCDQVGNRITPIQDVARFELVQTVGDGGYFTCDIPLANQVYAKVRPENRIHVYRQQIGGQLKLLAHVWLTHFRYFTADDGQEMLTLYGGDNNALMIRRISAYRVTTITSQEADDRMKGLILKTFGSAATLDYDGAADDRSLDDYGFQVEATDANGPLIWQGVAWKNVLSILKSLQTASRTAGSEVFWWIEPLTDTTMEFRTKTDYPGEDRTADGVSPIIVSEHTANLRRPILDIDYTNALTRVYAGGQGQDTINLGNRIIEVASDADLEGISPFARREGFLNATRYFKSDAVQDAADNELARKRPASMFTGEVIPTDLVPYGGSGWHLGDLLTVYYLDYQFDAIVRSVRLSVGQDGSERVTGRLESRDVEVFI